MFQQYDVQMNKCQVKSSSKLFIYIKQSYKHDNLIKNNTSNDVKEQNNYNQ